MEHMVKIIFILATIIALCSCGYEQSGIALPVAESKEDYSGQLQDKAENENLPTESTIQEILHNFNWMGDNGNYENEFASKPFLKINTDGSSGAAGVYDINRDGEPEFLMSVYHVPRGIPSVEVFAVKGNELQSVGGFFESRNKPQMLSYYTDEQGQLLFLQETEAHYGGITKTLVVTYVDNYYNVPIACIRSHYGQEGTELYYIFPASEAIECTNSFLSGDFDEKQYAATEEEHSSRISEFMDSLTWMEDVSYGYGVQYHLYNSYELPTEIRYDEISQASKTATPEAFQTEEEYKKTSDMVADALYKAYIS